MITSDFHMHTAFSTDSKATVKSMVDSAIEKGLQAVCITDHYDEDFPFYEEMGEGAFTFDPENYFRELEALKNEYVGKIDIGIGIETGLQQHLGPFYKGMTETYPFDYVIGSVHVVRGTDPYFGEIFRENGDASGYQETFEETIRCLKNTDAFDVLGHIDYVVRYGKGREKEYSYEKFAPYLDEILRLVIQKGKGIELNTAGLKYGLGFCHPHPDVLRRYRELGGEIITVGSDAHRPEHVAYDFGKAQEILELCGFRYYTEFHGRSPVFKKI